MVRVYVILCVVAFSVSLCSACGVCSHGCLLSVSLDRLENHDSVTHRYSCPSNQNVKLSSISAVSSDGNNDKFTVTVMDKTNYDRYTRNLPYDYEKGLSTGRVSDQSLQSICFGKSITSTFVPGTVLYVVIKCTNKIQDCQLTYDIDFACLQPSTVDSCVGVRCVHGTCKSGICVCDSGYIGSRCACDSSCDDHGECIFDQCVCDLGYTGTRCETKICDCISCGDHGACNVDKCVCDPGYTGSRCQTRICDTIFCEYHGTCNIDECVCDLGYTGSRCGDKLCDTIYCNDSSLCTSDVCVCDDGSPGRRCSSRNSNSLEFIIPGTILGLVLPITSLVVIVYVARKRFSRPEELLQQLRPRDLVTADPVGLPQTNSPAYGQPTNFPVYDQITDFSDYQQPTDDENPVYDEPANCPVYDQPTDFPVYAFSQMASSENRDAFMY